MVRQNVGDSRMKFSPDARWGKGKKGDPGGMALNKLVRGVPKFCGHSLWRSELLTCGRESGGGSRRRKLVNRNSR